MTERSNKNGPIREGWSVFAEELSPIQRTAHGFYGGELLNVCFNAIEAASIDPDPKNWRVTEEMLMAQVRKVQSAKRVHSGRDDSRLNLSLN